MAKFQKMQPALAMLCIILSSVIIAAASIRPPIAQVFSELENMLVDYSKSDIEPAKACRSLHSFKSEEIIRIEAAMNVIVSAQPGGKHDSLSGTQAS